MKIDVKVTQSLEFSPDEYKIFKYIEASFTNGNFNLLEFTIGDTRHRFYKINEIRELKKVCDKVLEIDDSNKTIPKDIERISERIAGRKIRPEEIEELKKGGEKEEVVK